jgi:hypothetical protein
MALVARQRRAGEPDQAARLVGLTVVLGLLGFVVPSTTIR